MTRLDQSWERMTGRVSAVIDAIDRGEDPQPAIDRLNASIPWESVQAGIAATLDAIDRTREADGVPTPTA